MNLFELVAKLTLDSKEYDRGLMAAQGKTAQAGGGMVKTIEGTRKAIKVAAVGMTAAITAFGVSSVKTGMEFDTAMSQVAATMGKSMDERESETGEVDLAWGKFSGNLREYAKEMGEHTKFSAIESAEALNYMALAGYDTQKSMEMLPNVLNLAAAGAMELADASDMVTDASSALGLNQEETNNLVDQMAMTAARANTSVEQLGRGILAVGGTAKVMNGGVTEMNAALGILADNGIKGAQGGTALRNVLTGFTKSKFEKNFGELGVSAYDAEGKMRPLKDILADMNDVMSDMTDQEKTQILTKSFNAAHLKSINALLGTEGERWDDLMSQIDGSWYTIDTINDSLKSLGKGMSIEKLEKDFTKFGVSTEEFSEALGKSGGDAENFANMLIEASDGSLTMDEATNLLGGDLESLQKVFDTTTGAAQKMADTQLDNLEGDITLLKSAFEGLKISVSDKLTPALRPLVQGLTWLIGKADTLGPIILGVASAVGVFALALKVQELGGFIGMITKATQAFKAFSLAFKAFSLVLLGNPIGLVIALIAGLAVAFITLWKNNETFRKKVTSIWNGIKSTAKSVWTNVKNNIINPIKAAKDSAVATFEALKKGISDKIEAAKDKVKSVIDKIKSFFPFNIGKLFTGWIPKISLKTKKTDDSASTSSTVGRENFAKAMNQPYMFKRPTEFYAGDAGDEVLYGRKSLMKDIKDATSGNGEIVINLNYDADADATDMLRDLSRGVQRYRMAGAI